MAAERIFGGELAFVADIDSQVNKLLAARYPSVANIGDITKLDELPKCDVLTAGFPCQPLSKAGKRKGMDDERWIWDDIERAIGGMAKPPRVLLFENVRGLLTANSGEAMARVVEGLRSLGYVGCWRLVSASDIGAPHKRQRIFIVAVDPEHPRPHEQSFTGKLGSDEGTPAGRRGEPSRAGSVSAADSGDSGYEGFGSPWEGGQAGEQFATGRRGVAVADADEGGCEEGCRFCEGGEAGDAWVGSRRSCDRRGEAVFGKYWGAVRRWEVLLGRAAPDPSVHDGSRARLNAGFVEWMMGLPDGFVTDLDLSRAAKLRILGNGVVPQQAEYAYRILLNDLQQT